MVGEGEGFDMRCMIRYPRFSSCSIGGLFKLVLVKSKKLLAHRRLQEEPKRQRIKHANGTNQPTPGLSSSFLGIAIY